MHRLQLGWLSAALIVGLGGGLALGGCSEQSGGGDGGSNPDGGSVGSDGGPTGSDGGDGGIGGSDGGDGGTAVADGGHPGFDGGDAGPHDAGFACSPDFVFCGGTCQRESATLCGASCTTCAAPASHGVAACSGGQCGVTCEVDFVPCAGACVSLATPEHCGACGAVCEGECSTGQCRPDYEWARWPVPVPSAGNYRTTAETVTDAVTGLTWQRSVPAGTSTWANAKSACAALTAADGGWRLPTYIEARSIVDFTHTMPSINATAFPNTPAEVFWTASPWADGPGFAWTINFDLGSSAISAVANTYRVRCVR